MLHILWLIIKFILIALGIVFGLLLLSVLLVLFCPVRYRALGVKEESGWKTAKASARISWLFRLISVNFTYRDGNMGTEIRLFGISLKALQRLKQKIFKHPETAKSEKSDGQKPRKKNSRMTKQTPQAEDVNMAEQTLRTEDVNMAGQTSQIEDVSMAEETLQTEGYVRESRVFDERASVHEKTDEMQQEPEMIRTEDRKNGLFQQIWDRIKKILSIPANLLKKAASIPQKVIKKIRKIRSTLRRIYDKIDWWKEFLFHPKTKAAISLVWQNAKGLIRHVMPVKIEGSVTFGSEDPAVTGAVLAVMGMTFPFHKNRIECNPLFDGENLLTGNVKLKGRIYGIVFLKAAIVIYFNKNIKYVISRWEHKEG